jgi:predicted amidohydrolase YtcJ
MADLALTGGRIRTMNGNMDAAEAVVIKDGKIVFVGSTVDALKRGAQRTVDLRGRTVLPGFIDSHIHCVTYAWYENNVKLHDAGSVDDVLGMAEAHLRSRDFGDGRWMIGRGWDEHGFKEKRAFTRQELDRVSADVPIAFLRTCGHACVVNTGALRRILHLEKAQGLRAYIDEDSGLLKESAARLFMDAIPTYDAAALAELIRFAAGRLNACGVTSVHSDDLRMLPVKSKYEAIESFRTLADSGELDVRVCCLNSYDSGAQLDEYIADGYRTGMGDGTFRIGPVKIITDGSLGGRTAALKDPYASDKNAFGVLHHDAEALAELVCKCQSNGLDVTIHAIGDRAMENAAYAVRAARERLGEGRRHGVLHGQVAEAATLEEMGRLEMQAFVQPVFVGSDMDNAERLISKPESKKLYAWKSMLDAGVAVSGGSCAPVEPINVLENIQYAITREKPGGGPEGGWLPGEKLSVEEAVRLFTTGGAYASYEEDIKGSIEVGKFADMVALDADPFETAPRAIKDIGVSFTMLGGRIVYENGTG